MRNSTVLWAVLVGTAAAMPPVQLAPRDAVIVLRNGECLSGRMTEAGDQILLVTSTAQVRLRRDEVDLVCGSLDEAFAKLHGRLGPRDLDGRLRLAQWCLRYGLLGSAGQLAVECQRLDPHDPRVGRLERQLELAVSPKVQEPSELAKASEGPTLDELDQLIRQLPVGTVESFAQRIQPLLLNHCGTSRCHGPRPTGETTWSLLRPPSAKQQGRRVTQRNLHTVLAVAGQVSAEESPLATVPLAAHGGLAGPVFSPHELDAYRQIVQWLRMANRRSTDSAPRAVPGQPAAPPRASIGSAAASGASSAAADPFDPAVFNARFEHSARGTPAESSPIGAPGNILSTDE